MALYQIKDDALAPLEATSLQNEEIWERRDLQRLLKDNIEVIGNDIMVIAEEFGDWEDSRLRIDLLAIDKEANLVVIELKRTGDRHMELQAIRYAAMVSNMTWEQACNAFKKYINENELGFEAETKLCEFLEWGSPREDDFAKNVRIILATENFSKELTTSVLWLNDRDLDISCVRLSLHKLNDDLVLNADQIVPLPEAESYQIEVKQKKREERISRDESRDHSSYSISYNGKVYEENFKKRHIGYFTVKLLEKEGRINDEVFKFLREDKSCKFQLLKTYEEMSPDQKQRRRYHFNEGQEITHNGEKYYAANNWGIDDVPTFTNKIESQFPEIKFIKSAG